MTKDLDVLIESSPANAAAVYTALAQFGAPLHDTTEEDFQTPTMVVRIGVSPICINILQTIDRIDFAAVYAGSMEYRVEDEVSARYISAADLITNKLASGLPQDLADVTAIRQAQAAKDWH